LNLANKLTVSRILIIPVMLIVLEVESLKELNSLWGLNLSQLIFASLFLIASFTDFLDGYIARKTNTITTFGKFLDPIADKVLVLTVFSYLLFIQVVPIWMMVVIIIREFSVSGFRLIAVEKDVVISAIQSGKYKTAWTMMTLFFFLLEGYNWNEVIASILLWITMGLTIVSGLEYFYKFRNVVTENK